MKHIDVVDETGVSVLRYIVVDDTHGRVFYGGNTRDDGPDNGPHVIHFPETLLDLIARLANEEDRSYILQSTLSGKRIHLQSVVMADDLADVLGIGVEDVLRRYSLLVRPMAKGAA